MRPLHVVYMLLDLMLELDVLISTLFSMSLALLSCLTLVLVLDGIAVGACSDLALLLTDVLGSKGASVHFKSVWFLLTCTSFSVQMVYDLEFLATTIPTSKLISYIISITNFAANRKLW